MDRRKFPRSTVRFRSSFAASEMTGGEGTIVDLSMGGCRIVSDAELKPGTIVEVRLHLPDEESPVKVRLAAARWRQGNEVGLEFLDLEAGARERIRKALQQAEGQQVAPQPQ